MIATAVVAALAAGCAFRLDGVTTDAGVDESDASSSFDASQQTDLSSPNAPMDLAASPQPDLAAGQVGGCSSTTPRVCTDSTHSAHCDFNVTMNAWVPTVDRACPPSSSCSSGHCQPPAGAAACTKPSDCSGGAVCDLFVVGGALEGHCTPPLAGAGGGVFSSCGPPYGADATCKTGFCALDANDSTIHQCLFPCTQPSDCGGNNCDPIASPSTIEGGVATGLKSCSQ